MPTIFNVVSFHSGLHDGFRHVHTMVLEEPALGSGNFGDVYVCSSINGASPPLPQVVKILRDDGTDSYQRGFGTIQKLQQQIRENNARRAEVGQPGLESLPALRALPQFSFLGEMDGREVLGYSATLLDTEEYISFDKIVGMETQTELMELYSILTIDERLLLAAEMAEGFQALSEMEFLHADINPPNLLVDVERCHLAIIDYDSGAVRDDKPTTFGKRDDWLAPEITDQLHSGLPINVNPLTDRWAVFMGIHHLLFLGYPLFFLTAVNTKSVGDFLRDNRWPHISPDHPFFNQDYEPHYLEYLRAFADLPGPLQKELSVTMNEGFFQPSMRTSFQEWSSVLRAAVRKLEIVYFTTFPQSVVSGVPARLSWSVHGAYEVHIDNGIGVVDHEGSLDLHPTQTCIYTLTARTRHGKSVSRCLTVRVWPLPELRSIQIPSCSVDQRISLRVLGAAPPQINIPVTLDLAIEVTEPSLKTVAAGGFAAARARSPKRFPGLQLCWEERFAVAFNQLKSRVTELIGEFV